MRRMLDYDPAMVGRDAPPLACLAHLDASCIREVGNHYLAGLDRIREHHCHGVAPLRIVDKMPDNHLHLGLIALVFPRATLIHARRDPRDRALSCWQTNFRGIRWADDREHLVSRLRDHSRLASYWKGALLVPAHEVIYERLVDHSEEESRRLVGACGLDWEPACLRSHETIRPVKTASVAQVRQPLYRRSPKRWHQYESFLPQLFGAIAKEREPEG